MTNPKLAELEQSFASIKGEFDTLKAEMSPVMEKQEDEMCSKKEAYQMFSRVMDNVYSMVDNCHARISAVDNWHYTNAAEHSKNHMPPFKSATQLKAFLKTCGMEDDYEVQKPVIYASNQRGLEVTLDYSKNTK